jgi:RNA polymerase sigma-70 factor (ECF subfamily)
VPDDQIAELYEGCFRRLVVQLYAVTGDLAAAHDAVREAFLRALAAPGRITWLADQEAWLRRVAIVRARGRGRRRILARALWRPDPPVLADRSPEHVRLMSALRRLPPDEREALALHDLAELSVDEVAETLEVPAEAVESRLAGARSAIGARAFDRVGIGAAIRQPPLDDLCLLLAGRRRRRSSVLVFLMVVALPLPLVLAAVLGRRGEPEPIPLPVVRPAFTAGDLFVLDRSTAVAVSRGEDCTVAFARTVDGGATWLIPRAPADAGPCAAGGGEVSYEVLGPTTYVVTVEDRSRLTADAGATWRDATTATSGVDAFPPAATPVGCARGCRATRQPVAVNRSTGVVYALRTGPWLETTVTGVSVAPDGSLWTVGVAGSEPRWRVHRSTDRGASWTAAGPPVRGPVTVVARDAREAYTVTEGRPAAVRHTTDGGATWTEVRTNLRAAAEIRAATVTPDGALLVLDSDGTTVRPMVSRDGGASFAAGPGVPDGGARGGGGLMWTIANGRAQVTGDGLTWTELPLPSA